MDASHHGIMSTRVVMVEHSVALRRKIVGSLRPSLAIGVKSLFRAKHVAVRQVAAARLTFCRDVSTHSHTEESAREESTLAFTL